MKNSLFDPILSGIRGYFHPPLDELRIHAALRAKGASKSARASLAWLNRDFKSAFCSEAERLYKSNFRIDFYSSLVDAVDVAKASDPVKQMQIASVRSWLRRQKALAVRLIAERTPIDDFWQGAERLLQQWEVECNEFKRDKTSLLLSIYLDDPDEPSDQDISLMLQ